MCVVLTLLAQHRRIRETNHYFYSNTTIGYSIIIDQFDNTNEYGGFGSILGLGYSYRSRGFWCELGAEFQELSSYMEITDPLPNQRILDTEGDQVVYHYNKISWHDRQDAIYIGIPVQFGFCFKNNISIGFGAKYSFKTYATVYNRLKYSTSATYKDFIEDFVDMPNHYYGDYDILTHRNITNKFRNNVAVSLEAGYMIYSNQSNRISMKKRYVLGKLSGFCEIGMRPIIKNFTESEMYTINPQNPSQLDITPYYMSQSTRYKRTIPIFVGIRWTYMLATITCRSCR